MQVAKVVPVVGTRMITMAEVELHSTKESAWFIRNDKVLCKTPSVKPEIFAI